MKIYRLGKTQYIHDLSGKGAFLFGGRWNFKGYPVTSGAQSRIISKHGCKVKCQPSAASGPQKYLTRFSASKW